LGVWALKAELEDLCFAVLQVFILEFIVYESVIPCSIQHYSCILLCRQQDEHYKLSSYFDIFVEYGACISLFLLD
jgi:hypothetical protein